MKRKASFSNAFLSAMIIVCIAIVLMLQWVFTLKPFTQVYPDIYYNLNRTASAEEKEESRNLRYSSQLFDTNYSRAIRTCNTYYCLETEAEEAKNLASVAKPVKAMSEEIPVNYTELIYPSLPYPVYGFIGENGKMNYRVMLEKSIRGKKFRGFVQATQTIRNRKISIDYDEDSPFISEKDERFGEIIATEPAEEQIAGLQKVFGRTGVYQRTAGNEFYAYGHYPNGDDSFFMADKNGNMIKGTLPLGKTVSEFKED